VFYKLQLYSLQLPHSVAWNNTSVLSFSYFPVNKQLNDKERVAAALENSNLLDIVEECLSPTLG
jgi:hypothetical protein